MVKLPIDHPQPDFSRFQKAIFRQGEPDRVPFIELMVDPEIVQAILEEPVSKPQPHNKEENKHYIDQQIRLFYSLGYDYVPVRVDTGLVRKRAKTTDTAVFSRGEREWVNQSVGLITNWQEFENYPWPKSEDVDYFPVEYAAKNLPSGMKIIPRSSGVLEWTMWLMGYENFSYALRDEPQLVESVIGKIGTHLVNIYDNLAEIEEVGAFFFCDDMGHRTGTLISPEDLKKYILPWHKKIARIAHKKDLPFLLHSCGNLEAIMDDLISYVEIDAKHSFEDAILPVHLVKEKYGDKICILGGVDMDVLARAEEEKLRKYVRDIIKNCAPGGGYCLGSGNSIANYVKLENYLIMLEEGWLQGRYPIEV